MMASLIIGILIISFIVNISLNQSLVLPHSLSSSFSGSLCLSAASQLGEELQEAATAALRATTSKLCAEPEGRKLFHLNADDLKQILDLYTRLRVF